MILRPIPSPLRFQSPFLPSFPRRNPCFQWRRRRRRPPESIRPRCLLEDFFGSLLAAFPSSVSLDLLLAPALGFASGAALYLASSRGDRSGGDAVAGDWILFTSPTPFNRCVLLRCPSVSFEDGGELLEGLNDRLVTEDRHYVNLSRGRIPVARSIGDRGPQEEVSYQRFCVGTDDGGVISLDWPENLDLGREHGLDTVVIIVPGTGEGSMDRNVKSFVYVALKQGYFPVVVNPRGCAGSPLTTPRLFTAADSDDISTAIQFINKVRPWSTFMSIGWGYGANMLTKYLAEAGESTPITAAVCIDNPFDLAEATRSFPHHIALDRKLTSGLVDILQTNKVAWFFQKMELFQGKTKGFDVEKALSSTTVRDFDKAISMISYGCDDIEDFYSKISTMKMIGSLKIPLLFIQSDDGTVPLFSVPRSSIAENPFTSLLLCSCLPSTVTGRDSYTLVWCQHLAIEWFSAVELTLLKGRHPLLKDLDVTINPTKGLTIVDDRRSNNNFIEGIKESRNHDSAQLFLRHKNHSSMKFGQSNPVNGFLVDPDVAIEDKFSSSFDSESITQALGRENDEGRRDDTSAGKADNTNVAEETDSEKSQVLESASVMMNMLDVTLPGTLDDEQKKKVLTAVGRGETFMKALQGAVPEDVRGKLTNAVTEIVQTQKANLNVKGLAKLAWSKDKMKETSNTQIPNDGASVSDEGCVGNFSNNNMPEITVPSDQTANQVSGSAEIEVDDGNKLTQSSNLEKISSDVDQAGSPQKVNQPPEVTESVIVDDKVATKNTVPTPPDGDTKNNIEEVNNSKSSTRSVETTLATSLNSDVNETGKEGTEIHKNENKVTQEMDQTLNSSPRPEESSPHSSSRSSSISVTQALDAITGFDDSTQMAVNSVFGVLENMIDQLEKSSNEANDNTSSGGEEKQSKILPHDHSSAEETKSQKIACANDESLANLNVNETSEQPVDYATKEQFQSCELVKEKMVQNEVHDSLTMTGEQSSRKSHECTNQINPFKSSNNIGVGSEQKFALDIARNPYYWGSPYNAYLQKHCFSQVPTLNSIDLDMATELFLDPEEGQWKMLDLGASDNVYEDDQSQINSNQNFNQSATRRCMENFIEPSYVILETYGTQSDRQPMCANDSWGSKNDEMIHLVKNSLLDSLKVEVGRRLGISKLSEIEDYLLADIEHVADSVIQLILLNNQLDSESHANCDSSIPGKFGTIEGHHITEIISLALLDASHLKKVLPDGLIVGSVLACLRNYFELSTTSDGAQMKAIEKSEICHKKDDTNSVTGTDDGIECQSNLEAHQDDTNSVTGTEECSASKFNNEDLVAGAVTAALGASAILAGHQQNLMTNDDAPLEAASVTKSWEDPHEERTKHEEAMQEKNHLSIVSSLAEKAFSVAGPVVPKKGDGEVDQERLVAVLAELGQKGGILKLVGKVALLWGGIRGAMSLTDRLISFLRIAERPLPQRILGFGFMVLVLWSPVVIPLLPTVVQSWTMPTSNRIAEYVCKIGLYVSVMILIMLWGKRIRGYDNPLDQYGLDLTMPWVHDFLKGLVGGTLIVTFVHFINGLLGISLLSWPASLPSLSAGPILVLKAYGNMILLTIQGIVTAVGIALVEELLFRSWLPEEVAVDFGFYRAIMISGITFSLIHRSLRSIPGFLMLSIALSGIKQRTMNRIHAPIGVRAGIIVASFTLQAGGFIKFKEGIPFWLINSYPMHPFDSAVGLSVAALLSIIFFPRQRQKISRDTEE